MQSQPDISKILTNVNVFIFILISGV